MKQNKKTGTAILALILGVMAWILVFPPGSPVPVRNRQGEAFAGTEACRSCHRALFDSFVQTAHHHSSAPASRTSVKGSFASQERFLYLNNDNRRVLAMEQRGDGLYQTAFLDGKPAGSHRFDVVIGSGRKGQSFLTWTNNRLYQLPASYFTLAHSWINSPGYPVSDIKFDRLVQGRCLECHTGYAQPQLSDGQETFDPDRILYGIGCERCHGAGAKHVGFHREHPGAKDARFIANPARLTRQQQLDLCALCHSGTAESLQPPFSYRVGDPLARFYQQAATPEPAGEIDVHGNQYGRLIASKCFIASGTLTCNSCHNTHQTQKDLQVFSQTCIGCHQQNSAHCCKLKVPDAALLQRNCIDCHMPVQLSKTLTIGNPKLEEVTAAPVRSHYISISRAATDKYLEGLRP